MVEIKGRIIRLKNNRSVFVGQKEGCDSRYIEFKNGGVIQRFRLSDEATDALLLLLAGEAGSGEPFSHTIADDNATDVHWRWQEVRVMDA